MKAIESYTRQAGPAAYSAGRLGRASNGARPVRTLQKEHADILKHSRAFVEGLSALSNEKRLVSRRNVVHEFATLRRLLTSHQGNEERVLFPIMSEYFDSETNELISKEHLEFSTGLKKLSGIISGLKGLRSRKQVEALARAAAEFDSMVREHFSHEENVVYWFASLCLTKKEMFFNGKQ